jgi:tRNA (cytidine/uridine-2'-O-)-methyltransferase
MPYNIVLIEPEIPNNTGNIGRLSLATGSTLHLVKPFGFDLSDSRLKRAGLDYWQYIDLMIYENTQAFFDLHKNKPMAFFSSHGSRIYTELKFVKDMFFIFGKESVGLPSNITEANSDELYKIPIYSPHIRSLNLANAVSVVVYEGLRQSI